MIDQADIVSELLRMEELRCRAVEQADIETLATLVADDLVHVHVTALENDRDMYLAGIRSRVEYKSVSRKDLRVRVCNSDVGIVTGKLINVHRTKGEEDWKTTTAFVTQVWKRNPAGWQQVNFQATLISRE